MRRSCLGKNRLIFLHMFVGSIVSFAFTTGALADEIGYDTLVARLSGQAIPNGAGINVAQVEAGGDGTTANYGPNLIAPEFSGKTFLPQSGVPTVSGHANTVAQSFYSNTGSIAGGVTQIYLWEANSFINSVLKYGQGASVSPALPLSTALKIYNNSWIGGASGSTPTAVDNEILRRADFAMNRDDTLYLVGMNNGATAPTYPLMAMGYHGLSVGLMDGNHSHGDVPAGGDGVGRMKPEIVAPSALTSWATPVVSSVAALLFQTAATHPSVSMNPNADETTVIKAVMMAGARHRTGWTNNPATSGVTRGLTVKPLDPIYGVDVVNVDRSHRILTGGERDGVATPAVTFAPPAGWDFEVIPSGATRYWRIRSSQTIPELSVVATWNRSLLTSISVPTVADINLTLLRLDSTGGIWSLEADQGAAYFSGGNVASRSTVDNVEHLYVKNLVAGDYLIEVKRIGTATTATSFALAWIMPPMIGDLNQDGRVDGIDLTTLLSGWGGSSGDVNGDGNTDGLDLAGLLSNWG